MQFIGHSFSNGQCITFYEPSTSFNVRLNYDYARILVADWCHGAATSTNGRLRTSANKTNGYK